MQTEINKRARALVDQMTIYEAASQLRYDAPAVPRLSIPEYNWWNEALHGVARAGTATVFPQAISMAAMFDTEKLQEVATTISTEARAKYNTNSQEGDRDIYKGLTMWSPNVNIFRDPRWGRGHETYGEDPYLTSRLGVSFVKGLQGDGKYLKTAACAKHFAVHSGPEAVRHSFDAVVGKKDLRETYLPAFEALVKEAEVESVMGAYNRVNGEPACGSKTLLVDILRKEWGFSGHVVSDCWAIVDFHKHHQVTDTPPESAALAIKNGCDLNCGNTYLMMLVALQEGLIQEEDIRTAATHLMATRMKLGMMDQDCAYDAISIFENDTDESDALALDVAEKSMVLLKNDGLLPLDVERLDTIAVIGSNANTISALEANYHGTSSRYVTFLDGIRTATKGKARLLYAPGCDRTKLKSEPLSAYDDDRISEAVAIAKKAEVVILCLGLDEMIEGEEGDTGNAYFSGDKADLLLPLSQRKLLSAILKTGTPVVTVLACGSAIVMEEGNAHLWAGYPGQAGGTALANLLFGKTSPSGKLPVTFYHDLNGFGAFTDYSMKGRTYRYMEYAPLYPFGYGLSYTSFAYENVAFSDDAVTFTLRNTGKMDGDEVVEAYIKANDSQFATPNAKLCAFTRVHVKAGESLSVTLPLGKDAFTVINDEGEKVSGGARYTLTVGGSQGDSRSVELLGTAPLALEVTK